MRKNVMVQLGLASSLLMGAGCGSQPKTVEVNVNNPTTSEVAEETSTSTLTWLLEPSIEAESLEEFKDQTTLGALKEGYPKPIGFADVYFAGLKYNADACGIVNGDQFFVMNYEGETLSESYTMGAKIYDEYTNAVGYHMQNGEADTVFSFQVLTDTGEAQLTSDYQLNRDVINMCACLYSPIQLCTVGGKKVLEHYSEGKIMPIAGTWNLKNDTVVFDYSGDDIYAGVSVITPSYDVVKTIPCDFIGMTNHQLDMNLNGFVSVFSLNEGEPVTIISLKDEKVISTGNYKKAKNFVEGYCPVSKDGKWAYIDEEGNEVTDFIFDDASTIYEGKAFVIVDGKAGILNIKDALDSKTHITAEMLK